MEYIYLGMTECYFGKVWFSSLRWVRNASEVGGIRAAAAVALIFTLSSCSFTNATQSAYNTAAQIDYFAAEDVSFLIAVEKLMPEDADLALRENDARGRMDQFYKPASQDTHPALDNGMIDELNADMGDFMGKKDSRIMVVTHLLETRKDRSVALNYRLDPLKATEKTAEKEKSKTAYADGYKALDSWSKKQLPAAFATARAEGQPFTHVMVMCMGWVNDQTESAMRYRAIMHHMRAASDAGGGSRFRPLVIGLSWPSGWLTNSDSDAAQTFGHLLSYKNKSKDADEVGLMIVGPLIHRYLANGVPSNVPIVAMGHSFGARVMSRAVYSEPLLKKSASRTPEILICLQPAYSIKRWMPKESSEGAPYQVKIKPTHYITTSKHDKANPMAFWTKHGGGAPALALVDENPEIFDTATWNLDTKTLVDRSIEGSKPLVIDAGEIVVGTSGRKNDKGGYDWDAYGISSRSGHNDTLDREMGDLLYHLVQVRGR